MVSSPILRILNRARELQTEGHDVISLAVGEPDWATYDSAKNAGVQSIHDNYSKYSPVAGLPELRRTIATEINFSTGMNYTATDTCVSAGAKQMIFATLQMVCEKYDEVIFPSPYWASYPSMVNLADATPRAIECPEASHFKLTPHQLDQNINSKTKAFIFCNPNNPTGVLYSKEELEKLGEVLRLHPQVVIISDDIYNRLVFTSDKYAPHILQVCPDLKDRIVVVNGASKVYSMTGWRVGWGAGPPWLMPSIIDFLGQSTTHAANASQWAALAALQHCDQEVQKSRLLLQSRRDWFVAELEKISEIKVHRPDGTFYCWVDVRNLIKRGGFEHSRDISMTFLNKHYVATVPGIEFGVEGYLRLSFSNSQDKLSLAINRLTEFVKTF